MAYITDLEEIVNTLRTKLDDYLILKGIKPAGTNKFCCFIHNDKTPSMHLNPKTNFESAHCFGCQTSVDIFSAAAYLDGLPEKGPDWVSVTIPQLAKELNIEISIGQPSQADKIKSKYYALARDISDTLSYPYNTNHAYMAKRGWNNDHEDCYTLSYSALLEILKKKGWEEEFIIDSKLIALASEDGKHSLKIIDDDRVTFIIKDRLGKPCAFLSRNIKDTTWKYIHSGASPIFQKSEILSGLDMALKEARKNGLWIVEGSSDRFAFLANDRLNVAACIGTALTENHLNLIKQCGITDLFLCLNWDKAGVTAIQRILTTIALNHITGLNIFVVTLPKEVTETAMPPKDVDEYVKAGHNISNLRIQTAFEWTVASTDLKDLDQVMAKVIPIIAASPSAMKRDELAKYLSNAIGISTATILIDVERIRNRHVEELRNKLSASAERYKIAVEQDPSNIASSLALHEKEIDEIESEYGRSSIGVNYQLARFDAIQKRKFDADNYNSGFNLKKYKYFKEVVDNGLPWSMGALFVFGGRANAAKTATAFSIAFDALVNDPDVTLIAHLTDDNYLQVEPRFITTLSFMLTDNQELTIGVAACPAKISSVVTPYQKDLYKEASQLFRNLIAEERLVVLDCEDGSNTSVLEKTVKYIRRKYPERKLLVVADGIHNYSDFSGMEQTPRITKITDILKRIATKFSCCVFATGEYRKNMPLDTTKLKLPVNDDLADARAIMFRANVIIHVYNDLNDRADAAEIYHIKKDEICPRLLLIFGKNKLTSFKGKLTMDLDIDTVTMREVSTAQAAKELDEHQRRGLTIANGHLVIESEYEGDEDESN